MKLCFICAILFILSSAACFSKPLRQSHSTRDAAILCAIDYCVNLRGEPTHCCVESAAGGADPTLVRDLRRIDSHIVGPEWIKTTKLTDDMLYLEINDFAWISKKRAKVQIYIAEPMTSEPGRRIETAGALFVIQVGKHWIVDEHAGGLRTVT